ncbi:MAG: carbon storage regulator [Bdellovibrionota bacterium]|nr:MAG: carbon storage regulator [Bdellovibrionota bacterium]
MLKVSRQEGESMVIGDPHCPLGKVHVSKIHNRRVKLTFEFAKEIPVHRNEVAERIVRERRSK